jgi:ABC-2 type transport system ATP-binding protein
LLKANWFLRNFNALTDVSFSVNKGDILGIIGYNGAGKSTMLKVISGIMNPTSGYIKVEGVISPLIELGSGFDMELNSKREYIFEWIYTRL